MNFKFIYASFLLLALSGCSTTQQPAALPLAYSFKTTDNVGILFALDEKPSHAYASGPGFFSTGYTLAQDCTWPLNSVAKKAFQSTITEVQRPRFKFFDKSDIALDQIWGLLYRDSSGQWLINPEKQAAYQRLKVEQGLKALVVIHSRDSASSFTSCAGPACGSAYNINLGLFTRRSASGFGYEHFAVRDASAFVLLFEPTAVTFGTEALFSENQRQLKKLPSLDTPANWKKMTCDELSPVETQVKAEVENLIKAIQSELAEHTELDAKSGT